MRKKMADRMIQKPLVCRNAHCGASCDRITVEQMEYLYKDITNCPFYERRDDLYDNNYTGKVLDKIRTEITEYAIPDFEYHGCGGSQKIVELEDVLEIIDKYKAENEESENERTSES